MNTKVTSHLGEAFRLKRKELNFTLKEVENATSIRTSYLQAIEVGEVSKLISPIYAKGFMKQYATYLGLDGDRIIRENIQAFKVLPGQQECTYGIGSLEMRGSPGSGVKWLPNVMWVAASVVIILVAWTFARYLDVI